MGFNNNRKKNKISVSEFVAGARGEGIKSEEAQKTTQRKNSKQVTLLIKNETIERLDAYMATVARRFESKSYLFNEAINMLLDSKGFQVKKD